MNWRRFDTLALRLFVLMWVTLVLSHLVAYAVSLPLGMAGSGGPPIGERLTLQRLPTLPSLPPGGPMPNAADPRLGDGRGPGAGRVPRAGEPRAPGWQPGPGEPPDPDALGNPRGPAGPTPPQAAGGHPGDLPAAVLWLDYGLRMAIIALGAALGARWLAAPVQRLARASRALAASLARGQPPPVLNERQGTAEVREAAQVFNTMAARLQEQFDARGMHLASVSHDLRTPLTRLRMRLETAPPAWADAANADIHEMSEMIDATLDVLHEQREGSQARVVDMRAMLQATVDDMAAAGHAVQLDDDAQSGPPLRALARPAALKRIVANLVGNALRYGGQAHIGLQAGDGGIRVTVDDNGPGIPADQLEMAFRPWVRLNSAHLRSGHGLGLAIARDLAGRDGGQVTLANRPQGGLRALLWLPQAPAPGAARVSVPGAASVSSPGAPSVPAPGAASVSAPTQRHDTGDTSRA